TPYTANSVSGTIYLDGTYDGELNDMATSDDKPLVNVEVAHYNQLNQAVNDASGHYVIEVTNTGKYSIGVAATRSPTCLMLPKGNGSTVDASKNLISFNYDRTEVPGTGGDGGGTVVVNYYAVNYIAGEYGVLNGDPAEQAKEGTKPQNLPTVTGKTGYSFKGWFLEAPEKQLDSAQQVVNKTLSFYAAYKDKGVNLITGEKIPSLNKAKHFSYLHGDNYGNVNGDKPMSRAEVVVIFSRLLAKAMPDDLQLSSKFTDVPQLSWYAPAVAYMEQFGIIDGYADGTFCPANSITRAEAICVINALLDRSPTKHL
ncbi:MAG: S-layer homology domain-containing protein, partial [Oscillospiraceae bacterium]